MDGRRPSAVRTVLISGAVLVFLVCAASFVVLLATILPAGFVDQNLDGYRGAKQRAVIGAVAEMGQRKQDGMGTYRVTAWRITSVEKCRTRCPHPYAVEVELFTLFGVPYGEIGVYCGQPGTADASRKRP